MSEPAVGKRKGRRRVAAPNVDVGGGIDRAGLHSRAAERLRHMIVRGELKPGERLGEVALCEVLAVSRTPLREAFKLLAAEGLLDLRPHRGATIARLDPGEIEQLFEAAGGIERVAAELAAARLTPAELEALEGLQQHMERQYEAGDLEAYFSLNQRIHRAVVAASKNEVLSATHEGLLARLERARYFALQSQARWEESVSEHRAILAALEARDGAAGAGLPFGKGAGREMRRRDPTQAGRIVV